MLLEDLKRLLQSNLTDGLVAVIGSGASAAVGLPTMSDLTDHLIHDFKGRLPDYTVPDWEAVLKQLWEGNGLETALAAIPENSDLIPFIVESTGALIAQKERECIDAVLRGDRELPLSRLWKHSVLNNAELHVVTTNYDRIIEFSAEIAGLAVDTSFVGNCFGRFDPRLSRQSLLLPKQTRKGMKILFAHRRHIIVHKPQGSLDWYSHPSGPIRCSQCLSLPRLMITPGTSKYRKGYDSPFDGHRDAANAAIDRAARFLVIGYGFNDDQLETHLRSRIKAGVPCVILVKTLTPSAEALVADNSSVIALCEHECSGIKGTKSRAPDGYEFYPGESLWDLNSFISEVLE